MASIIYWFCGIFTVLSQIFLNAKFGVLLYGKSSPFTNLFGFIFSIRVAKWDEEITSQSKLSNVHTCGFEFKRFWSLSSLFAQKIYLKTNTVKAVVIPPVSANSIFLTLTSAKKFLHWHYFSCQMLHFHFFIFLVAKKMYPKPQ